MSRENIDLILSYISKEETPIPVNIMGGEPFLYNDLPYLVRRLNRAWKVKSYTIFTGGVFKTTEIKKNKPFHGKLFLVFNLNQRKDYDHRAHFDLVHRNIQFAIDAGVPSAIGFNIYSKDFDSEEIIKYCYDYGTPLLRLAVAKPTFGQENKNLLKPEDFQRTSCKLMELIEEVSRLNIRIELDCMMPKCFFSTAQLGRLALIQPSIIQSLGKCGGSFDIGPDLSVFRCFATSPIEKTKLTNFSSIKDASDYFKAFFDDTFKQPNIFKECKTCDFALDQSCQGDCLSYQPGFNHHDRYDAVMEKLHHMLQNMDLTEIPFYLTKLRMDRPAHTLLAAYYYYYTKQYGNALHCARKTVNQSSSKSITKSAIELIDLCSMKDIPKETAVSYR
jgi:cyclic pyranopterin phosphate synthase